MVQLTPPRSSAAMCGSIAFLVGETLDEIKPYLRDLKSYHPTVQSALSAARTQLEFHIQNLAELESHPAHFRPEFWNHIKTGEIAARDKAQEIFEKLALEEKRLAEKVKWLEGLDKMLSQSADILVEEADSIAKPVLKAEG